MVVFMYPLVPYKLGQKEDWKGGGCEWNAFSSAKSRHHANNQGFWPTILDLGRLSNGHINIRITHSGSKVPY